MTPEEVLQQRALVVKEALTWERTPHINEARVKGAGVDCGQFPIMTFSNAGMIELFQTLHYPHDWHMHRKEERYLEIVHLFATEVPGPKERTPLPADLVIFNYGLSFSHGAIVVKWPNIIHASTVAQMCIQDNYEQNYNLRFVSEGHKHRGEPRPMKVFVLKPWLEVEMGARS